MTRHSPIIRSEPMGAHSWGRARVIACACGERFDGLERPADEYLAHVAEVRDGGDGSEAASIDEPARQVGLEAGLY